MITKRLLVFLPLLQLMIDHGLSQGFVNLNFESANVAGASPGQNVTTSSALPGWSALFFASGSTNNATQIWYDNVSLGGAAISINDSNTAPGFVALQGRYSVYLFGGPYAGSTLYSAAISQTAVVPIGTQSIFIDVQQSGPPYFAVFMNGLVINMLPVQTFADYTVFGGNVSQFAGQLATLTISQPPPPSNPPSGALIDNIMFSTASVPEPSALGLIGVGILILAWRRRNDLSV